MKVAGILAEYNPFHFGHQYHIEKAREVTGADYIVAVISGPFSQSADPGFLPLQSKVKQALLGGADLVFLLPHPFATGSAETFARGGIKLLNSLSVVDTVVFGSECGDIRLLTQAASKINNENEEYRALLQTGLKKGETYPKAVSSAVKTLFPERENISEELKKPNNILGIEYIRAIQNTNSSLTPVTIKRTNDYHGETRTSRFLSASAIRSLISASDWETVSFYVPSGMYEDLRENYGQTLPLSFDDFSFALQHALEENRAHLEDYADFTRELKDRVNHRLSEPKTATEWAETLKTKNVTYAHIKRALLHVLTGVKKSDMALFTAKNDSLYAHLIGFRKSAKPLLGAIKKSSSVPLFTKTADAKNLLTEEGMRLLSFDIRADELYRNSVYQKFGTRLKDEYRKEIIIL